MRLLFPALFALVIALAGGAWSAMLVLDRFEGAGILVVGPWHAERLAGSPAADPYSKARTAIGGNLTLGLGEGIAFRARTDSAGQALSRGCVYRLTGSPPPARVWTLAGFDPAGRLVDPGDDRPGWLLSGDLLRQDDNAATIWVGPQARPENWLATQGGGPLVLALTLYDTPASTDSGAAQLAMPAIERTGCMPDA